MKVFKIRRTVVSTVNYFIQGDSISTSGRLRSERYAELFDYVKEPLFTYLADNMSGVMSLHQKWWTLVINALKPNGMLCN